MKSYAEMDEMSADILKELGNIGTGNAITSLAQMMGIPLDISSPSLHLAQVQEIYTLLEQSQEVETGILVEIKGEITGMFLFFLNESFTNIVLDEILEKRERNILELDDLERSLLSELGNIMCGSYIRALSALMDMDIDVSVPEICVDMGGAILSVPGNIGTGNAITSLAQMMGIPLDISSPSLHLAQVQEIYTLLEQSQEVETGILVEIKGEITGMFLFFLNESFTNIVLDEILEKRERNILELDDLERSLLSELGNIMCGSYIRALSALMDMDIDVSVPEICVDMGGAILSVPLARIMSKSADILLIENQFQINHHSFSGRILFFPDPECLEPILMKLGIGK